MRVKPVMADQVQKEHGAQAQVKKKTKKKDGRNMKKALIYHSTHSFEWRLKSKKSTTVTCNKSGTVKNSLRRSSLFRQLEDKNPLNELVVVRNDRPIPPHFPCSLIQPGEKLIVKYVKPKDPRQPMAPLQSPTRSMNKVIEFNVVTKGGKNIKRILRNPLLNSYKEVTVYGYKGEKVKHALKRDGRFLETVFNKTCALSEINTNVELSNLVDDIGGKTFEIIMLNKNSPPESQPSSLDESVVAEDSASSDRDENDNDGNNDERENHLKHKQVMHEIPGSKSFRSHLLSLVSDFIKRMFTSSTGQASGVRDLLCVAHGRSQGSFPVSAMTELMRLKSSVCQVRIKGIAVGSGFLLFDAFVLTNHHVIEHVFDSISCQLFEIVTVDFSFESVGACSEEHQVQEVVAFENWSDESGQKCDWALLSLTAGQQQLLPGSLLPHCGVRPLTGQSGSICIIGHPGGGVKSVDLTWVIPVDHCEQIIRRHFNENLNNSESNVSVVVSGETIQFAASEFANSVAKEVSNTRDLSYDTCFYFGASGSPVFDSNCNVVAMHSGGYAYKHSPEEIQSVIEYGHPLSSILENLIVQLVHRQRLDVLKKYLEFPYRHHEFIKRNVKKLVDSRNDTTFKSANCNSNNDYTLKKFFEFICQTDPPVPMVI